MKIKAIIIAFTLLTISTALMGLFFYYNTIRTAALKEKQSVSKAHAVATKNAILQMISRYQRITLSLSGHAELQNALADASAANLQKAHGILDLYNSSIETSVCYLLNIHGVVIASSNRNDRDNFIGKDYSFRPYFKESMRGAPFVYMAQGVTSGKRGIYFSNPVYANDKRTVIGVCVIKENIKNIESDIIVKDYHVHNPNVIIVANEDGVIFISNRKDLLLNTVFKIDGSQTENIAKSLQFGKGPWYWSGFKLVGKERVIDQSGHEYNLILEKIREVPGWMVLHLIDSNAILRNIHETFLQTSGYVFSIIFAIIGMVIVLLNYQANNAERKLNDSEERYRSVTEAVDQGLILQASSGEMLTWNRGAEKIFGIPAKDVIGQKTQELDWPTIREDGSKYDAKDHPSIRTLQTGEACTNEIMGVIQPSGQLHWISINTNPLLREHSQEPYAVAISFSDITERRRAEAALRESEEKFRFTFKSSPDAIIISRMENGHILDINDGFTRLTGYNHDEVYGKSSLEIGLWNDPADRDKLIRTLQEKGYCENLEAIFKCKDGSMATGLMSAGIINLANENYIIAITRDISDRKHAEAERERLLMAIEQANESVAITDAAGIIRYVNPAFEIITGYPKTEATGQNPRMLKSGKQASTFYKQLWQTVLDGKPWSKQLVNKRKNGDLYTAECSISPIKDAKGNITNFVWISRDITKVLELEKRAMQSQKMESIGALAGGIAHDFNNLLYPIMGMSEMLMEDTPANSPLHEYGEEIFKASKRAADLVKQILSFSRQTDHQKKPIQIQSVIEEVLKLTRASIPANIDIAYDLQNDEGLVMADPTQIHQVAMNLLTNSYHALEDKGGKISVKLEQVVVTHDKHSDLMLESGTYARMTISDTGCGIRPEIIRKIFDPFFTTKGPGKGTGMGLSVAYGIIKDHGGDIRVISETGGGATFYVYLPMMENEPLPQTIEMEALTAAGTESILLVDDDAAISRLGRQILERVGYKVDDRTSSIEALNLFRSRSEAFDLVITDMTMPQMTGDEFAKEILAIRPEMPVVMCTGYSDRFDVQKAEAIGIKAYLMKPIVRNELTKTVREVLDNAHNHRMQKIPEEHNSGLVMTV